MSEYPVSIAVVCKMLLKAVTITTLLRRNGEVFEQAAREVVELPFLEVSRR